MKTLLATIRQAFRPQPVHVVRVMGDKVLMSDWTVRPAQDVPARRPDMPTIPRQH